MGQNVKGRRALVTGASQGGTGRSVAVRFAAEIAYSLKLLLEPDRPAFDLAGKELIEGWQPEDLPSIIKRDIDSHAGNGWPDAFDFHRPRSPVPSALL